MSFREGRRRGRKSSRDTRARNTNHFVEVCNPFRMVHAEVRPSQS
jgi:hypothetical protein